MGKLRGVAPPAVTSRRATPLLGRDEPLKTHAHIKDAVAFVGLGQKFQIWEPDRFRAHLSEANEKVRAFKKRLSSQGAAPEALGARE